VPLDVGSRIADAARAEGGWLNLLTGPATIDAAAALARTADAVLARDARYRTETTRGHAPRAKRPTMIGISRIPPVAERA
jgi:hypothetical protein